MGKPKGMRPLVQAATIASFLLSFCILAVIAETDPDIIFDDSSNAIKLDADNNLLKNRVNPLTSPLLKEEKRFSYFSSDDEDLYGDGDDGPSGDHVFPDGIPGSGDGAEEGVHVPKPEEPIDEDALVYMRATFIVTNIEYKNEFSNIDSIEFINTSGNVANQLRSLYYSAPEVLSVNVVSLGRTSYRGTPALSVTADIEISAASNQSKISNLLKLAVNRGYIGGLRTVPGSFSAKYRAGRPTDVHPRRCGENELRCHSGGCFHKDRQCDGHRDCSDGSDEYGCREIICPRDEILCDRTKCISKDKKCNNVRDCVDGTDEEECAKECGHNEFQCGDGRCIPHGRCNGRVECSDGSDERNCYDVRPTCKSTDFICDDNSGCVNQTHKCDGHSDCLDGSDEAVCKGCSILEFPCNDGRCIPAQSRCNQRPDCSHGEDEAECQERCPHHQHECDNGRCIDKSLLCNGHYDCRDRSDEEGCVAVSCPEGEWRCRNGQCIDVRSRCNGRADCADFSDEIDCADVTCPSGQWRCRSGQCIDARFHCNRRVDCADSSDETECADIVCPSGQWRCRSGQCIDARHHCNGRIDCADSSDEAECADIICPSGQWRCRSGQCIEAQYRCNGRIDCADSSDEAECVDIPCTSGEWRCRSGECIDVRRYCDKRADCADSSDEAECADEECPEGQWKCGTGHCIDVRFRCNRRTDCPDASDETGCAEVICPHGQWRCRSGQCIDARLHCNGRVDCADSSDEAECADIACTPGQWRCRNGQCIDARYHCNGRVDCEDSSDETECADIACPRGQWRCRNGQCIDARYHCNGRVDCADSSDETQCADIACPHGQWRCRNGQCIDARYHCNGRVDCADSSDETQCGELCISGQFACGSGECIDSSLLCNRIRDCADGSDEERCRPQEAGTDVKVYPERQRIRQGREVVFRCRDEGSTRLPVKWRRADNRPLPPATTDIRGRLTMPNIQPEHSGAYICSAINPPSNVASAQKVAVLIVDAYIPPPTRRIPIEATCNAYDNATCQNGECIPRAYVCDGDYDCTDRSDEINCGHSRCEPNEFQCDNQKCILKVWRCDGDNDCEDNSDERNCAPTPGSPCHYGEYRCSSGDQCIPKSFQCDTEFDCQDNSDEIGCAPPTITQPPPDTLTVEEGSTISISCTAVGTPTPVISWRLNWGHIPPPPRVSVISENGRGTVTIHEAKPTDQGAWSCEAINSKDSVLAVPDCILVVKSKVGLCRPPLFNEKAESPSDCLRCFCFGITDTCYSSSLHVSSIHLQTEISIVALQKDYLGHYVDVSQQYPPNQNAIQYYSSNREYRVDSRVKTGSEPTDVYYFWSLPPEFLQNQLNSYGGYIRYTFRYRTPSIPRPPRLADVIIKGNNITLYHVFSEPYGPNRENNVQVRFWEGNWHRSEAQGRRDVPLSDIPTRDEILTVLQNVEAIYLRASYDEELTGSSILNFQMDTASITQISSPQAVYVEKCSCPQGYTGNSCETCAEGYTRSRSGGHLGQCVLSRVPCNCHGHSSQCDPYTGECMNCNHNAEGRYCERCKRGFYGDARRGTANDCQPCPCPLITPSNQFSPTCRLESDGQVTCDACPIGYEGRRCERCAPGYEGNPGVVGGSCSIRGGIQCDPIGSVTSEPSHLTGLCQCKPHVTGERCNQCRTNTFHLHPDSPLGCVECFCMAVTAACGSSSWHREQEVLNPTTGYSGIILTNSIGKYRIESNLQTDFHSRALVYRNFAIHPVQTYFWQLPSRFLGDKVTAYGGKFNFTIMYTSPTHSEPNTDPNVKIMGNEIVLIYQHASPLKANALQSVSIPMYETSWRREDGHPVPREIFLMALADLDEILIKATYTTETSSASLLEVSMDIAVDRPTGQERAWAVEQCRCPIGYTGLSCEDCDSGYTRSKTGIYLGLCEACFCNGHSSDCDPEKGFCQNCQHNTVGDFCEECVSGFYGDATNGTPNDCQPAVEPPCQCDSRGSVELECDFRSNCPCKTHVQGKNCNRCKEGYFNLEAKNPEGCSTCFCFGVTQQCSSSSYYRDQIHMRLQDLSDPYNHNFQLTDRYRKHTITEGILINQLQNEVSFSSFSQENDDLKRLFWSLPADFLGNKLASYGGKLRYTQLYVAGDSGDTYSDADIQITGNGIAVYYVNSSTLRPLESRTYEIEFKETNWQRVDSRGPTSATREDFMRVLANIEVFLIRASYHSDMRRSILRNVILDTAVPQSTGQSLAVEVEQCVCPPGYTGLSCEECAPGYIRDTTGPGLGRCTRCSCNGHSESCDANSGRCVRCRHNTMGDSCEQCIDGYYGDPLRGTSEDCKPCPCPLTTPSNQFSPTCRLDTDGQPTCTACAVGYVGRNCEKCSPGYRGNPVQPGGKCEFAGMRPPIQARIEEPRIQRVPVGATVTFRCSVSVSTSTTQPQIVWTKQGGMPAQATEASGVLTIPNVRPEDTGIYTCTVSDLESASRDHATLTVEGTGRSTSPRVRIEPRYLEVKVGEPVEFRCIGEGFPQPTLRWTGGLNNQLNPQSTFVDGVFRIPAASQSDQAEYKCSATNSAGTVSVRTVLYVTGGDAKGRGPELTVSPSSYEAQRGETVRFDCQVAGTPVPTIQWTFSGGEFPEGKSQVGGMLILPAVTESHQGVYVCTASNSYGTAQAQAQLLISTRRVPPSVRIEPERQTVIQGQNGELRCVATGTPAPIIRWKKSGEELTARHKILGEKLIIEDIVVEDRGLYVCTAENRDGSAQGSAIIEVERREIPSIELYPSPSQVIQHGGNALFQCRVLEGIPSPTVEWTRADGSPFSSSTEILTGGVIRFNRVTGNEEGIYICTAENIAGRVTAEATLRIQGFPTIRILQRNPYRVRPGETVRLECTATGEPRPNLVWKKLHQPLERTLEEGNAVLRIDRVKPSDSGIYICSAQTAAGISEERIQLIVEDTGVGVPAVSVEERVATATVGSKAELRCIVQSTDRDIALRWERADGRPIVSDHTIHNGILTINNIQPEDAGEYNCLGISGNSLLFVSKTVLAIVAPPRIQLNPLNQSAKPGDIVRIYCTATGDQPITIDWSRPGGHLARNVVQSNGILEFRGITLDDAGRYLCTAVNAAGKAEGSAEILVNEQVIPGYREETGFVGSNVELKCPIAGFPNPLIEWTKDGGPLPENARQVNNELRIQNLQLSNAGRYFCTAINNAGKTQDYVTLNVRDIPTIEVKIEATKEFVNPGDTLHLRCKVRGDPSARIQWSKLGHIGPLPDNVGFQGPVAVINGVSAKNGGVYRCTVDSYIGTRFEDYVLTIQVPPSIPPFAVVTKVAAFGHNVVLNCTTNLDPPVAYTWSKQGGSLPSHSYTSHNFLEIRNITASDAGTYICTARSSVGTLEIPTILVVTGIVPRFTQTPLSFLKMDTLSNVYQSFEFEISFMPESPDGLLLYNGNKKKDDDFVSLGLKNHFVELRYNLGSGVAILQSPEPLEMGKWHTVHVVREGTRGIMKVNDYLIINGSAPGTTVGLDLDEPLYIGSVPDFRGISRHSGFSTGFIGCISQFHVGNTEFDLLRESTSHGVINCDTCAINQCEHGGVCQPALTRTGFECICPAGFSGEKCEKITETCYPGVCGEGRCVNSPGGGFECFCPFGRTGLRCQKEILIVQPAFADDAFVAYPIKDVNSYLKFDMKVKLRKLDDGLIAYSAQNYDGKGDFVSLAVRNKSLEFQFDTGSGPALLKSPEKLQADQWVIISAERTGRQGSLLLNNGTKISGSSPGHTRGLDLATPLYIGGYDKDRMKLSPSTGVTHGFDGCIAHIEVNSAEIEFSNSIVDSSNVKDCGGAASCSENPCLNNGICREESHGYSCTCREGYTGVNCEIESELCGLLQPCQNGATCEDIAGTFKCHCPLGYSGSNCTDSSPFSDEAMFEGDGYLSLSQSYLPRPTAATANKTELISFSFVTEKSTGLLLFQGQKPHTDGKGADYLALAIVDGYLEFSYQLGSGPAEIRSAVKVDDGKEHTVVLRRTGSYGILNVDSVDQQEGYSLGNLQMLNAEGDIYIGGVPNYKRMTDNRYLYGFHGCIWDVQIQNSKAINLYEKATSGRNVKQCPDFTGSGESTLDDLDAGTGNFIKK